VATADRKSAGISSGAHDDSIRLAELMHEVWLAKKIIELVCSGHLAPAGHDYTRKLDDTGWHSSGTAGPASQLRYRCASGSCARSS